ncbi:MAG: hypothetical protein FJZ96_15640 [Chloroflexi bacterium]|nr:hypothetical protein [Chloroflexota bacterium]
MGLVTYGFIDTGYIELLDYGTTFDGNPIVNTLRFGNRSAKEIFDISSILRVNLIAIAKSGQFNLKTAREGAVGH